MTHPKKYLLIIDDSPCNTQLVDYFAKFDYEIIHKTTANNFSKNDPYSALIVNESYLKNDLTILNTLFQTYLVPIIVISDHIDEEVCVQMLEAGADDFMIKPLLPRELHARICAISRRVQRSNLEKASGEKEVFLFSRWRLYPASRQVFNSANQELQLSAGEYDLLFAFIKQPQQILPRDFLLQVTKNQEHNPFGRKIDVQISRLRQKIETDADKPALIKTIRNSGYLFTAQVVASKEIEQ